MSLNPCCNGKYSQRQYLNDYCNDSRVLILVLMEDTLRVSPVNDKVEFAWVLILVLMEDTLREFH